MKKIFSFILIVTIANTLCAQTKFEEGYFINNEDKKVECFIRNDIWRYNPVSFSYKMNQADNPVSATVKDVKEFGLDGGNRFISTEVMVDISSEDPDDLSQKEDPEWMKMHLFLSVLVDGKATLYKYHTPLMLRFFYSKEDQPLQQLVYKNSRPESQGVITTNYFFRKQLWISLNYEGLTEKQMSALDYSESHLVRFFTDYNKKSGTFKLYRKKRVNGEFHIRVNAGPAFSTLKVDNVTDNANKEQGVDTYNYFFDTRITFRAGASLEFVLPNTNKKIAFLIEPTFRRFHEMEVDGFNDSIVADISLIDIPIGFRYYAFLNQNLKVFGNVNIALLTIPTVSNIYFEGWDDSTLRPSIGLAVGGGVSWKRFSGEFRFNLKRKLISNHSLISKYGNFEFIFGYRIF